MIRSIVVYHLNIITKYFQTVLLIQIYSVCVNNITLIGRCCCALGMVFIFQDIILGSRAGHTKYIWAI